MKITNHTELLQALAYKHKLYTYLELGVQNPNNNFSLLDIPFKTGVDPEYIPVVMGHQMWKATSDEFFSLVKEGDTFDLIFIDGLHHADQVKRDFENSLRCLSDNGFIVIHDTLPDDEIFTLVPRTTKKWFGNVYQFAMHLNGYDNIGFITFNIDCGCTLVWKEPNKPGMKELFKNDWQHYKSVGRVALNVTDDITI